MAQLTPEQIKLIQDYFSQNRNGEYIDPNTGRAIVQRHDFWRDDDGAGNSYNQQQSQRPSGYMEYEKPEKRADGTNRAGDYRRSEYTNYDTSGNQTHTGKMDWMGNKNLRNIVQGALIVAGAGAAGGLFGGGIAGGGVAGPGEAGWGMDLGVSSASDIGLSEIGLAGEGAFTATNAAGGAATGSGVGGATVLPATTGGTSLLNGAKELGGKALTAGKVLTAGAGLLSPGGGGGGYGGGGGGGGGGIDERDEDFIYGENGLRNQTMGLLNRQMSPENLAGWDEIKRRGMGLLQQPIAPNGFERFYGGGK